MFQTEISRNSDRSLSSMSNVSHFLSAAPWNSFDPLSVSLIFHSSYVPREHPVAEEESERKVSTAIGNYFISNTRPRQRESRRNLFSFARAGVNARRDVADVAFLAARCNSTDGE